MKKTLLVLSMSLTSFAYAESNFYISAKTGASISKVDNSSYFFEADKEYQIWDSTIDDGEGGWVDFGTTTENGIIQLGSDKASASYSSIAAGFGFALKNSNVIRTELEYSYKAEHEFKPKVGSVYTEYEFVEEDDGDDQGFEYNTGKKLNIKNSTQTLMLNSYFDFVNSTKFTPYMSAGVGVARHKYKAEYDSEKIVHEDKNNFVWSLGVGVAYNINKNLALDLGYKFSDLGKYDFKTSKTFDEVEWEEDGDFQYSGSESSSFKFKNTSHDLTIGLRYTF